MQSPKEYILQERQKSGYYQKFGSLNQEQLQKYLAKLPSQQETEIANQIWKQRDAQTLSEIWETQTNEYREQLLLGITKDSKLKSLIDETYIGVLPTGEVNAFAKYSENGERMIILNEGLLHTIHYWSSFFLRSLEEGNDDFFWKDVKVRNDCLRWIYCVWNNNLTNSIEVPDIYPKTKDSWQLSQALTYSGIVFIMGHEFGYLLHNHKGYTTNRSYNHRMEFDADRIGMEVSLRYSIFKPAITNNTDNYYTKFMLFGPYLVLNILALFGINDSNTHPSLIKRIKQINREYNSFSLEFLGKKGYDLLMADLDIDYFDKMKVICDKMLLRHLAYGEELNKIKKNWP